MMEEELSRGDLLNELRKAEAELEDLAEVRLFTLGQTGVHLGAGRLKSMQGTWARDEARLKERIVALRERLSTLS